MNSNFWYCMSAMGFGLGAIAAVFSILEMEILGVGASIIWLIIAEAKKTREEATKDATNP